jgi:hypothetical protein
MCETLPHPEYSERLTESDLALMQKHIDSGWRLPQDFDRLVAEVRFYFASTLE